MANTGLGKGGKGAAAGDKTGGSDTLNFTYSSAVEAALEQLEIDKEEEAKPIPRKKRSRKGKDEPRTEEIKPKQKIQVFKLDQIYNDWCQVRELNTPHTDRTTQQVAAPPTANTRNNQRDPPGHPPGAPEAEPAAPKQEEHSPERKGESKKEEKGSPEERRKRERDKDEETVGNKSWHVKNLVM